MLELQQDFLLVVVVVVVVGCWVVIGLLVGYCWSWFDK